LSDQTISKDNFANELIQTTEKIQRLDGRGQLVVIVQEAAKPAAQYELDLQRAKWKDANPSGAEVGDDYFTSDSYEGFDKETPQIKGNPFDKLGSTENISLSRGNLATLLGVLKKCEIKTEEDAEMALQVSNALTASLFKYRVKNMPKELLTSNLSSQTLKMLAQEESSQNEEASKLFTQPPPPPSTAAAKEK